MTKLDLTVSASTLECVACEDQTALILGIPPLPSVTASASGVSIGNVLADDFERQKLQSAIEKLRTQKNEEGASTCIFETLNLVFVAPNAPQTALPSDRSPMQGVFSSPIRAMHTCGPLHLSCFTHVQYDATNDTVQISALEYAREHRKKLLQQEFASWLVEEHIEKAVIATTADGTVVFWNRFATQLYQWNREETLGKEIRNLISSHLSREQGDEMMQRMAKGEHFTSMYRCTRKDKSEFMAHATATPIQDSQGQCQFIVGVSDDYSQLHDLVTELEQLNDNLEKEVVARTEQLMAREKHLRMIGAAMKESDTGVLITDQSYKITWCNDAVSRMLRLKKDVILGMFPWDLPLQQEQKPDIELSGASSSGQDSSSRLSISGEDDPKSASSLESYFLREKALNETPDSPPPRSSSKVDLTAMQEQRDSRETTLKENKEGGEASVPANPSPYMDTSMDTQYSEMGSSSSKRPPIAAICYRIDSPSRPLHVMVSVEVMPTEAPVSVKRSVSCTSRRRLRNFGSMSSPASDDADAKASLRPSVTNAVLLLQESSNYAHKGSQSPPPSDNTDPPTTEEEGNASTPENNNDNNKQQQQQFMITLRDITAQRKAEEAQLIAERASAANEAKTQMMQMLSHELRTPLQGIMGVASTSMMDIEDSDKASSSNEELARPGSPSSNGSGVKGQMYDSLSTILASSRLLLTLINNTLDTRKINADMMQKIELSTVSMMACVRDSFQYCGPFASINEALLELADPNGKNVKLSQILTTSNSKTNLMSDVLRVKYNVVGNRLRLEQVIVNLLSNGIKYTTPGTSVVASVHNSSLVEVLKEVKTAPSSSLKFLSEESMNELEEKAAAADQAVAVFSVRDHGKGIPPEEYGKVFGEFQQLDVSTEKDNKYEGGGSGQSSGSGLGLNLSMKFVTLMNGHIWFKNCEDGKGGVTFSFYLYGSRPQRESVFAAAKDDGCSHKRVGSAMNESLRSDSFRVDDEQLQQEKMSRIRVLLIDDSMINLKVLARMLTKLKVQHCKTALSGAAALEYLDSLRNDPSLVPNLILCDLQMPGMDGFEVMSHLREMNICSSPIVMACSADWGSETEGKCHDVGFDGLLRKPITVTYLKEFLTNTKLN